MRLDLLILNENIFLRLLALLSQLIIFLSSFIDEYVNTIYEMNKVLTYMIFLIYCLIIILLLCETVINEQKESASNMLLMHLFQHYYLFVISIITGYMSYMYYNYDYKYKNLNNNEEYVYNNKIQSGLLLLQIFMSFYLYMDYSYMTNKQGEKVLLHGLNIILSIVNISYAMKLYTFFDKVVTTK